MDISKITTDYLKSIDYKIRKPSEVPTIEGVVAKDLKIHLDGRGDVIELFSFPWIKKEGFTKPEHVYQSATDFGVTKCWHVHQVHTDQFVVTRGKIQITLVDIREESATFGEVNPFIIGMQNPQLIKVPPGIMHGWKSLSRPEVIVINFQSHTFDPEDEYRYLWDCVLKEVWEPRNG